ncbi:MAG TPA: hypothetical protein VJ728_02815, partial [Candidatus Binataceae bacterium]|nr:hypothetical protein [Candidatus Binataceae bacterium]
MRLQTKAFSDSGNHGLSYWPYLPLAHSAICRFYLNKENQWRQAARLEQIASSLNDRQRAYLLAVYAEDQRREKTHRGPHSPPASSWCWIEYGPVGAKWLDNSSGFLLR